MLHQDTMHKDIYSLKLIDLRFVRVAILTLYKMCKNSTIYVPLN